MPLMQLKMLVLPAPLGPMMARKSWGWTSRLTPERAATPPNWRYTPSRLSRATWIGPARPGGRADGRAPRRSPRPTTVPKGCPGIPCRASTPRGPDSSDDARVARNLPAPGEVVNSPSCVETSRGAAAAGGRERGRSVEADDLHPVRAFPTRILLEQPERPAGRLDRVHRDRVRLLPGRDQEPPLRIDREAAWLLLGGRAPEVGELPGLGVDAERPQRARRALGDVEELAVR